MKVVHLLKHAVRGNGSVHVAVDLACAQVELGHEVWFCSARGSYDDVLRAHGVQVVEMPEAVDARSALRSLVAQLRFVLRVRPDILHAHMMSSAVLAAAVAALTRRTLVTTVHNSFDRSSVLMRLGRRVIAVSQAERDALLKRGFAPERTVVVVNGTDASPRETIELDDIGPLFKPSIMSLSGLHRRKAVNDLITAFGLIAPEFPEWHLNVVGWGPDREHLETQVANLELAERIHFLGSTLTPRPLLESSEIFATATLADPCPLSVMEARTAGCAIVGTTVGGVPEILDQGDAGQLVPPQDPAAMAAALRRLLRDSGELERWRKAALAGSEYYTVARMAADHDAVYRAALGR